MVYESWSCSNLAKTEVKVFSSTLFAASGRCSSTLPWLSAFEVYIKMVVSGLVGLTYVVCKGIRTQGTSETTCKQKKTRKNIIVRGLYEIATIAEKNLPNWEKTLQSIHSCVEHIQKSRLSTANCTRKLPRKIPHFIKIFFSGLQKSVYS